MLVRHRVLKRTARAEGGQSQRLRCGAVVAAHSDSLIRRRNDGQPLELVSPNPRYHVDLPRLRQGAGWTACSAWLATAT